MKHSVLLLAALLLTVAVAQDGARYLIITADQFEPSIRPLAEWKHASGVPTRIAKLSETGSGLYDIQDYIEYAYNNWPIRPEFVLLVGHPSILPAARYGQGGWRYYSDNYYADMGGDVRAEIAVGRFPVSSASECELMVAKTLAYERNPDLTDTLWMRRLTTVIRDGYDSDDTIYRNNARHAAELADAAGFVGWDSLSRRGGHSASHVVTSVNNGTGFVMYRGTASGNWREPFEVNPDLTANGSRLPVVLSITCQTMSLNPYESMIGREWLRTGSIGAMRGAVAFFGNTHSAMNVAYVRGSAARGFFTGLFADNEYRLGNTMLRAKQQLYQEYPQYTSDYRGFSLFGDPELKLWTATPRTLAVTHPLEILVQPQSVEVTVRHEGTPVGNALVCLSMDSTVYAHDFTDSLGTVTLNVTPVDTGALRIVVTGQNCRPYDSLIRVVTQIGVAQPPEAIRPTGTGLTALPSVFSRSTHIRWSQELLPGTSVVVRDAVGCTVRTLRATGQEIVWDGVDATGTTVRTGIYFCELLGPTGQVLARVRVTRL